MTDKLTPAQDRSVVLALRLASLRLQLRILAEQTSDPVTAARLLGLAGPPPEDLTTIRAAHTFDA